MPDFNLTLIDQAGLPLLLAVICLSAWLKRTRVALLGCVLSAAAIALSVDQLNVRSLPQALLPVALLLLALWPDAKVFSASSALYLLLVLILSGIIAALPDAQMLSLLAALARPLGQTVGIGTGLGLLASAVALLRWVINARAGLLALAIVGALATIGVTQFKDEPLQMAFLTLSAVFLLVHLASQAYRMSYLDALTELNGRRALTEELGLLGNRYVIAMLDIDHFKSINDRYGHDVGDQVLRNLAKRLRGVKGSRAFRFGGEEFCLTFSRTPLKLAVERMEGLRVAIEADVLSLKGKPGSKRAPPPLKLTVSVGVAESAAGVVAQDVLKAADQALYRAKQAGRNRVLAERS